MPKESVREQFDNVASELDYSDEDKVSALIQFIEEQGLDEPFMDYCERIRTEHEGEEET